MRPDRLYGTLFVTRVLLTACWGLVAILLALPAALRAQRAEVLWDTWGVPHIYAEDDAGAFYGMGWAEAESYGDVLLNAYLRSRGEAARFLGAESPNIDSDRWVRTLNVARVARAWERQQTPAFARDLASFAAGVNDFFLRHPSAVPPALRGVLPIRVTDVLGTVYRTWFASSSWEEQARSWALDHGWQATERHEARLSGTALPTASNALALGPARSRSGSALLLINPHVNVDDRWFEAHIVTPRTSFSGIAVPGSPVMISGFNDHLGWAITNNDAIRHTVFSLTLTPHGYRFDSRSVAFTRRDETIRARNADGTFRDVPLTVREAVQGPVIDDLLGVRNPAGALALRITGEDRPGMLSEYWDMQNAVSLEAFTRAVRRMQVPFLNHTYADHQGHILFQSLALIPQTAGGTYEYWRDSVIPGDASQTLWHAYVPYDHLPRVLDPPSGWVQNSNDPPWTSTIPTTIDPGQYPPTVAPHGAIGFRPQRAIEMVLGQPELDFAGLLRLKQDTRVTVADRVLPDLLSAAKAAGDPVVQQAAGVLEAWDRHVLPDSRGAVLFYEWFKEMGLDGWEDHGSGAGLFATPWSPDRPAQTPLGLADRGVAVSALRVAAQRVLDHYHTLDVPWGQIYRVRIAGLDLPASGGPDALGVYRVLDKFREESPGERVARYGDMYAMIVEFTVHPHAEALLVSGNTSRSSDSSVTAQAQMFGERRLRPVLRDRADVEARTASRETLHHR